MRASLRRIQREQERLEGRGRKVINAAGKHFRLGPMPTTPGVVGKCYASRLGNCKGGISREHFISEGILKTFEDLHIQGLPFLNGERKKLSAASLASNCLCEFHNSFLHTLDDVAIAVFEKLVNLFDGDYPVLLAWGPSFERWCLKALLGTTAAEQVRFQNGKTFSQDDIPLEWVEILFGLRDFQVGQGLYMPVHVGKPVKARRHLELSYLGNGDQLGGISLALAGSEFMISLAPPEIAFNRNHPHIDTLMPRPQRIRLDKSESLIFFWD